MGRAKSRRKTARDAAATSARTGAPAIGALPRSRWFLPVLGAVLLATALAFSPALTAPFQFDDIASISGNPTITAAWPPGRAFSPPNGITVSGRPVVNYSLALNYAANAALGIDQSPGNANPRDTIGYHVVNLALHLLCGLLLFGIVRRTIRTRVGNITTTCIQEVTHTRSAPLRGHGCWVTDVCEGPKEACARQSLLFRQSRGTLP